MPIARMEFFQHEHGMGDKDRYSLARDTVSGAVLTIYHWSHKRGDTRAERTTEIALGTFLGTPGAAQDKLIALIGTLVRD